MTDVRNITIKVNGESYTRDVETRKHLGDFLRQDLELTGTHLGCEHGVCGACTILVDGEAMRSCLMFAVQADGKEIMTIEGLAGEDGTPNPLQKAFHNKHALQCGFCTPGMLMSLMAYLRDNKNPDEKEIRRAISGNICRCTGYQGIVDAALEAADAINQNAGG